MRLPVLFAFLLLSACRSNPFGNTPKPAEDFQIYLSDFTAQSDGGMKSALLDVINSGKVTLHCAFSAMTLPDVTQALIAKARTGVQVKVVFDADAEAGDPGSIALAASGVFRIVLSSDSATGSQLLYGNGGAGVMRHNFCLADERHIYISTAAPDGNQMRRMPQIALRISGPAFGLAGEFLREANLFSQLAFGASKTKADFSTKFGILDQAMAVYWGPQEDPMDVLGEALANTASHVDFYSTSYQTTNANKAELDVPQVLSRLEGVKKMPLRKVFPTAALYDSQGRTFTLSNPLKYANAGITTGANIIVIDRGLASARAFLYTGALRAQANSSDDSVLIELGGRYATEIVGAYLDKIAAAAMPISNIGDISSPGAVVINEIQWMGSYSNSLVGDGSDEFVEFYNITDSGINLSGWKFVCSTGAGAVFNSSFTFPPGALIGSKAFFVVATKSPGAFPGADFFSIDIGVTNSSQECRLMNARDMTIDVAGDGMNAFDGTAALGTNDTANKIRRSMERINPLAAGNNITNWQPNTNTASKNSPVQNDFSAQTFATPGAVNSSAIVISLLNPSFESALAWTSLTSGALVYDAMVNPHNGAKIIHYNSLTSSISGREFQSECIAVSALTSYTASIYGYAPATNAASTNAGLKLWWYSDVDCGIAIGQSTQPQSAVSPQGVWNLLSYSQISPAGTRSMRMSVRARYATAAECSACANIADMVYFDSAGITTP